MDFWKTIRVLLRRWRVAVPVFAVSLGLAAAVYVSVHTEWESTGTIVLASPTDGAKTNAGNKGPVDQVNPLLAFDASLNTSATIIIQKLQDPALMEQLVGTNSKTTYQIGNGQLTGPFIVVVANARSPEEAKGTVSKVLDRAKAELKQSQEALKAPASTFITPQSVIDPTKPEAKIGGKVRFAGIALVLGFIASLSSAYMVESVSQSRKKKRTREEAVEAWQHHGSLEATNGTPVAGGAGETMRMHPITPKSS
ncbi:hypothetical protein [Actinocrispum wychmicini]|uniref:Capsular polysaccharide biosynthesis protein n=1 Tax=Actinocrispum wychmicini TaxID=1213861 RepID=A0A4V2S8T7_9PSEU|nr:hypothetical protein [Actinocrispum wychmicini]TCO65150.1 capsular polysaccharide biosynthesis protein [Actinocrispum wychmicini]